MTKKKRLLLIASFPLAVVLIFGVLAMLPHGPGVTKANFDRIKERMTKAEVDELFGGKEPLERIDQGWSWQADDRSAEVYIGFAGGGVAAKFWFDINEPIIDKIRRWLHLL
jgi:hypothetical protein